MLRARLADHDRVARGVDRLQQQRNRAAIGCEEEVDRLGALRVGGPHEDLALLVVLLQDELTRAASDLAHTPALESDAGDLLARDLAERCLPVLRIHDLERVGGINEQQQR